MCVSVEREEEEVSRFERLSSRDGGEERREGEEGEGFEGGCRACTCKLVYNGGVRGQCCDCERSVSGSL